MTFDDLVKQMDPHMHQAVKQAVELGKWPDGKALDVEQRKICMRALIVYENRHIEKKHRSGFMSEEQVCVSKSDAVKDAIDALPIKWS